MSRIQFLRRILPNFTYTRHRMMMITRSFVTEFPQTTPEAQKEIPTKPSSTVGQSCRDEGNEFRYLLRHSSFVNMGDPQDKVAIGKIFQVVNNDLYIDFGWKFHCVCQKPMKGGEDYVRGAEVLLRLKNLELSSKFLGSEKGLTLLEADASVIKLLSTPAKQQPES